MARKAKPRIVYTYRGTIERGAGKGRYRVVRGYSETTASGSVLYPWLTKAECRKDAASRGAIATFEERPNHGA